jgi:hypothetical protein
MKTLSLQSIERDFPNVIKAARALEANPQKTVNQRIEASEIRQRMEQHGQGGLLQAAIALLREVTP